VVEAKGLLLAEPAVALLEGDVPLARRVALVDNRGGDVLSLLEEDLNALGIETEGIDAGALRRPRPNLEIGFREGDEQDQFNILNRVSKN